MSESATAFFKVQGTQEYFLKASLYVRANPRKLSQRTAVYITRNIIHDLSLSTRFYNN